MDVDKLLDVEQTAEALQLHPGTVYRMARAGRLPCIRIGGRVLRFDPKALDRFLKANSVGVRG